MRSLGFKVVDEFSHDRARSEQRIAPGIYAIIRYFTSTPDPDWIGQSESLRVASKWTELAAWSQRWHEAYPTSAPANTTLGMALQNMKQFTDAKYALLRALQ